MTQVSFNDLLLQDVRYVRCGDSNGRLNGVDYFHCESNCGSFVSWDKLFLPSNFDDTSDMQSTGREYIARDVKRAVSTETLSSYLYVCGGGGSGESKLYKLINMSTMHP